MAQSSLAVQMMLQPVQPGGIDEIIIEQLEASMASFDEDHGPFVHICQTLYGCVIEITFVAHVEDDKWECRLGHLVDDTLNTFAVRRHSKFLQFVAEICEQHWPHDVAVITEAISDELWQVVYDADECISQIVEEYYQGRHYMK